jgi:hypothetical protein
VRRLAEGGSGEERGDFKEPPSCGECVSMVVSRAAACEGAEPASLRFLVEAVVKFGAYLEPAKLQSRRKGGREGVKDASGHPQAASRFPGNKAGGRCVCAAAAMGAREQNSACNGRLARRVMASQGSQARLGTHNPKRRLFARDGAA